MSVNVCISRACLCVDVSICRYGIKTVLYERVSARFTLLHLSISRGLFDAFGLVPCKFSLTAPERTRRKQSSVEA